MNAALHPARPPANAPGQAPDPGHARPHADIYDDWATLYDETVGADYVAPQWQFLQRVLLPGLFELDVGSSRDPGNVGLDYARGVGSFSVSDVGLDRNWTYDRHVAGVVRLSGEWNAPVALPDQRPVSGENGERP